MSKNNEKRITIRVSPEQHAIIGKNAKAANMSINQYMVKSSTNCVHHDERMQSVFMGQMCVLANLIQTNSEYESLRNAVLEWRRNTIHSMGC